MTSKGTQGNQEREKSSHRKLKQKRMEKSSHRKLKQKLSESKRDQEIGDHGISKVKEYNVVSGDVREALPRMAPEPFRGKSHLVTDKVRDRGLSKVNEQTVVSGGVRGALPSMAPEPFRGKSRLVTDKKFDAFMKNKGLDKMDYSRSGPGTRVLKRSGHQNSSTNHHSQPIHKAHSSLRLRDDNSPVRETAKTFSQNPKFLGASKKRMRNEDLEVNSPRTDIHINGPQSEEHIGSTSNGTTVMRKETTALSEEQIGSTSNGTTVTRKETRALSATKRNRLNNRKLVFEVDDCAGRIVGEDSQTFITKGGCLVRKSAKFDGTTWRKQPLLKADIISKCMENSSFNLNCQSMARAINSQLASQHKTRRWRLHNHYKNYPTKEQAIMNPPRGVKIPDWVLLCDRFASEDFQKISARNKMNRSKNLVPPAVGSKSMARLVHMKMKQGKKVTAIGQYELCHYSSKKNGMINETAEKILRDLQNEEANSSSTPAEICIAKLGHIPGYLKGRSASGRNILANERLQRELQLEKEKTKKLQMHINKIEKKHNNLKQKVDYLMKHLPRLSGWQSQGQGNEEYAGSDDDDDGDDGQGNKEYVGSDDDDDRQGNEEYDGFDNDDDGDDVQGNEEYNGSDDDEYGDDGPDDDGEEHEDVIRPPTSNFFM